MSQLTRKEPGQKRLGALEGGDDLLSRFSCNSGPKMEARSLTSLRMCSRKKQIKNERAGSKKTRLLKGAMTYSPAFAVPAALR